MTKSLNARYAEIDAAYAEKNRRIDAVWRRSMTTLVVSIVIGLPMLLWGSENAWIGLTGGFVMLFGTIASMVYCHIIGDRWVDEVKI